MQWLTSCAQSRGRFVSACSTEFAVIADGPTGRAHQKHLMDTFRVGLFVAVCALFFVTRTSAQIVVKGAPLGSDDSKSGSAGRPHRRCEHSGSEPRDRRGLRHHKKVHLWLPPFRRRPRHGLATAYGVTGIATPVVVGEEGTDEEGTGEEGTGEEGKVLKIERGLADPTGTALRKVLDAALSRGAAD